jgi:hypothetical protein
MDEELRGTDVYYPHTLVSYYVHRDKFVRLPSDGFVLGDSGGFSLGKFSTERRDGHWQARRTDPVDVIKWQARECTVGVLIDIPPGNVRGGYHNRETWEAGLAWTIAGMKRALPTYLKMREDGHAFRWWGVAHGWSAVNQDAWRARVAAVYPFVEEGEGWGYRAEPTSHDPVCVANGLHWLARHKIKRAHFFAAGGVGAVAVLTALGPQIGLEFVTCDSQVGQIQGNNRRLLIPTKGLGSYTDIEERGKSHEARHYVLEKCDCFSCAEARRNLVDFPDLMEGYSEYWTFRFTFHNLSFMIQRFKQIEEAAQADPDALLREVLTGAEYTGVLRAFAGEGPGQRSLGMPRSLLEGL